MKIKTAKRNYPRINNSGGSTTHAWTALTGEASYTEVPTIDWWYTPTDQLIWDRIKQLVDDEKIIGIGTFDHIDASVTGDASYSGDISKNHAYVVLGYEETPTAG